MKLKNSFSLVARRGDSDTLAWLHIVEKFNSVGVEEDFEVLFKQREDLLLELKYEMTDSVYLKIELRSINNNWIKVFPQDRCQPVSR